MKRDHSSLLANVELPVSILRQIESLAPSRVGSPLAKYYSPRDIADKHHRDDLYTWRRLKDVDEFADLGLWGFQKTSRKRGD